MVRAALRSGHHSREKYVFQDPLSQKYIAKKMPMFGPMTHPGCLQAISLLKDCIRHGELVLGAKLELEAPIVTTVTNAVPSKDSIPCQ